MPHRRLLANRSATEERPSTCWCGPNPWDTAKACKGGGSSALIPRAPSAESLSAAGPFAQAWQLIGGEHVLEVAIETTLEANVAGAGQEAEVGAVEESVDAFDLPVDVLAHDEP